MQDGCGVPSLSSFSASLPVIRELFSVFDDLPDLGLQRETASARDSRRSPLTLLCRHRSKGVWPQVIPIDKYFVLPRALLSQVYTHVSLSASV